MIENTTQSFNAMRARFRSGDEVIAAFRTQLLAGAKGEIEHAGRPAATNLLAWCRTFTPHYFSLPPSALHVSTAAFLTEAATMRGANFVLEGPRDSAKSTLATFGYPLWAACEGHEQYILLIADTGGQAARYLENLAGELENNQLLKKYYPSASGVGPVWNRYELVTNSGVRIASLGARQKLRGLRHGATRPTCVIVDDPEGDEAGFSARMRYRVREWYTKSVLAVGVPRCNHFLVGTRLHRECLTSYIRSLSSWKGLTFKAVLKWPSNMGLWSEWERIYVDPANENRAIDARTFFEKHYTDMVEGAQVLWPERINLYALMCKRALMGHASFESEYQNNPIDPLRCEWSQETFEGDDIWFDEWPEGLSYMAMALDPSKGRSDRHGDFQAIVAVGWKDGVFYVDAELTRRPIPAMIAAFIGWGQALRPDVAVVEAEQFQEVLCMQLNAQAQAEDIPFTVGPITHEGVNKAVRIRRLSPWLSQRRVKFKRRSAGVRLLIQQMQDFPCGDHDDGPDALEMAVRKVLQAVAGQSRGGAGGSMY